MNIFFKKQPTDHIAEAPKPTPILLVGGERFFSEKVFLPEEILPKNLNSFLEMSIEGLSPFPLEQLYWGFFWDKNEQSVLLYAMYAERFNPEEKAAILADELAYVFPSFIAGLGQKYNEPTVTFISTEGSLSALFWEADSGVPSHIQTVEFDESLEKSRKKLLELVDTEDYKLQAGYWQLQKSELLSNKSVRFESLYYLGEEPKEQHVLILTEKDASTWNADIRPKLLTHEKHKQEKIAKIFWFGTLAAVAVFIILAITEVLDFSGRIYLSGRKAHFAAQEAKVKSIESQESLVQKIEHLGHNYYLPLKMLGLLNDYRPQKVYFTSVILGNKNNVTIEGVAQSVDELNKYTDDLNSSGLIDKFDVGQIVSRQGRITFKMDVTFKVQEKLRETIIS